MQTNQTFRSRAVPRRRVTGSNRGVSRSSKPIRINLSLPASIGLGVAAAVTVLLVWAVAARALVPKANSTRQTFDAILILGSPADSDGNPTPEMLDRVTEGVHEYERGVAPRILVSGGAAHNNFIEADVMARVAHAQGVPAANIFEEPHALDTIQNECYSLRILANHDWHSVEIISAQSHLPRAAMIFRNLIQQKSAGDRIEWRTHPAPDNLTPGYYKRAAILLEVLKTARYLVWARWADSCA